MFDAAMLRAKLFKLANVTVKHVLPSVKSENAAAAADENDDAAELTNVE